MTFGIEPPSLVSSHGVDGVPYLRWSTHCRIRIGSRMRIIGGSARSDEGRSRHGRMMPLGLRVFSSNSRNQKQIYGDRVGEGRR